MGLFGKKKEDGSGRKPEEKPEEKQQETKVYIQGAGGTIVTRSILDGTSKLKWLFRLGGLRGQGQPGICG